MDKLTQKFDNIINDNLKINNKYISAALSLCLILYAFLAAPKLPNYITELLDYKLSKIIVMFLILFVSFKYDPSVSLIVSISVILIISVLNLYKHQKENMAEINKDRQENIPEYVYSSCGNPRIPNDIADGYRGEHGEFIQNKNEIDGPISGVSDEDMKSLCMHLKDRDINATKEILSPTNFSEISNASEACTFSQHQYTIPQHDVQCTDPKNILGNDEHLLSSPKDI